MTLLREGLLQDVGVVVVGAAAGDVAGEPPTVAGAVEGACGRLGARVCQLQVPVEHSTPPAEEETEAAMEQLLAGAGRTDMLVVDMAALFAAHSHGASRTALMASMQECWEVTRALVNRAFLAPGQPGRVVYLAPAPNAGEHAGAVCSALENLGRTLSVEWSRHQVTVVTVAPGEGADEEELATLVGYLASPAGAYFSGCLLDLRGAGKGSAFTSLRFLS